MKNLRLTFVILFLFSIKCSAQYFEGVIIHKMTDIPEGRFSYLYCDTTEIYTVKDDKVRLESSGQFFDSYHIYSNSKSGEIVSCKVDTIQKYYNVLINDADGIYIMDKHPKKYKSQKRKNMKILGYDCKHYYVKSNYLIPSRMDYWITDSIIPNVNGLIFIKDKGVILKSIYKSANRKYIDEVVAIHPQSVSSELFKIPADCKPRKSKIPEAMRKYKVDEKLISRDSLRQEKSSLEKKDLGKWGDD